MAIGPGGDVLTKPDDLAAMLARVARRHGVPPAALIAMVAVFLKTPSTLSPAALERLLSRKAGDFLKLRRSLAQPVADSALARWRAAAAQALEAGQFAELDKALAQSELQILGGLSDLGAMPDDRRRVAGDARADRAAASLLELSPEACREAAKRLGEAAAIVGLADAEHSHQLALRQADVLMRLGEDFADRSGFDAAIAHLRALIGGLDNFDDTVRWAAAQERLGLAVAGLGGLTSQPKLLHQAAACYRTALEDLRKPQAAPLWVRLQRHLGAMVLQIGEASGDIGLIEEAVDAFRAVLAATDRAGDPQGWARVQYDIGRANAALGQRSGGMASLEAAFNGFQFALDVWSREAGPELWSDVQDRMGQVLRAMGERYSEPVVLEEAVAAFGRALEERGREAVPLLWATSSANQALATMELARRRKDLAVAQQALAQIMAAVEAMRAAGYAANAAELQKKLIQAAALAESLRKG